MNHTIQNPRLHAIMRRDDQRVNNSKVLDMSDSIGSRPIELFCYLLMLILTVANYFAYELVPLHISIL